MKKKQIDSHNNPQDKNYELRQHKAPTKREARHMIKNLKVSLHQYDRGVLKENQKPQERLLKKYKSVDKCVDAALLPSTFKLAQNRSKPDTGNGAYTIIRKKIEQNKKILDKIRNYYQHLKEHKVSELSKSNQLPQHLQISDAHFKNSLKLQTEKLFKTEELSKMSEAPENHRRCISLTEQTSREILALPFKGQSELFLVVKLLGSGSFGKVYLVQHLMTKSIFALKVIIKKELNQETKINLIREIKIQSFLNHPNIIHIYGFTSDAEKVYLLLEPCLGSNVFKKFTQQPLAEKQVKKHIKEVCSAVEYLHKNDVIHRDIKAENILLHQNTVKLCDFGWAVHATMLRNTQCGTPVYAAPEIVKHQFYDSEVDVWCIGILTFQMLFGTSPFAIRQISDLSKIIYEDISFPKEIFISDMAKDFVAHCLQKKASERVSIYQAYDHQFLAGKTQAFRHTLC